MGTKNHAITIDESEIEAVVDLHNAAVAVWNYREKYSPPGTDLMTPVADVVFIAGGKWPLLFQHLATGHVYRVVIRGGYEPFVTKPANELSPKSSQT